MTVAAAIVNLILGLAYIGLGLLIVVEMHRDWWIHGFSQFGAAIAALAFTCGPVHAEHGLHLLVAGRQGQALDVGAVAIGLVPGLCWLALRVEAYRGGRGDRFIAGTPAWVRAIPLAAGAYALVLVALLSRLQLRGGHTDAAVVGGLAVAVIYGAICAVLTATQLQNHRLTQGWSLSGLSLAGLFGTCLVMHGAHAAYLLQGTYAKDWHGMVGAVIWVPAGLWFLTVVVMIHRQVTGADNRVSTPDAAEMRAVSPTVG